jgi:hypothetical protein
LSLAGAALVPIGILLLYVTIAGEAAFALNGESRILDIFVQIAALVCGMVLVGMLPFRPWVRVLLAVLYIPVFGFIDIIFVIYFSCAIGRGCL